jgi:thiamine pyrophosphate-dependent acetolactate synthase large subunit-like protein
MGRNEHAESVQAAAQRLADAQHVAKVVGGRAARQELNDAKAALSQAAGVRR